MIDGRPVSASHPTAVRTLVAVLLAALPFLGGCLPVVAMNAPALPADAGQVAGEVAGTTGPLPVRPLRQRDASGCGQTSVAMAVNYLTGKSLTGADIASCHGYRLREALDAESAAAGYRWADGGNIGPSKWSLIERRLTVERTPVVVGLNGPTFSPSGRGHIVVITGVRGEVVTYADPADGRIKTTTKKAMNRAPSHPDGNFIFHATKRR